MEEIRAHLKEHGYVLVKNFLSAEVLQICKSFLDLAEISDIKVSEANHKLVGDIEKYRPNIFTDSLLLAYRKKAEEIFEAELIPSYIFLRQYYNGSELKTHRDRPVCEFSITVLINKDGDQPSSLCFCDDEDKTNSKEVFMEEGDAIFFFGAEDFNGLWHYRPKVEQRSIIQAFFHYVSPNNKSKNIFPDPIYRD